VVVSLADDPVVDGTLKSCAVCVAPLESETGMMSAVPGVLFVVEPPELALMDPLLSVVVPLLADVPGDAIKFMPVDAVLEVRLSGVTVALAEVPDVEVGFEADEPAVTDQSCEPLLDSSHGVPDADEPPLRLTPMT
jgi:hypothetical protein